MALFLIHNTIFCFQNDSIKNKKLNSIFLIGGIAYGTTLVGLSQVWYKEQGFSHFRFFNDNAEWNQVDKVGHFYSTYHLSGIGSNLFQGAGMEEKKAILWSSILGTGLLLPIEILDGFSPEFGFSYGDMIANAAGSAFYLGQELLWQEQRIKPKFSFHQTTLSSISPHLLGSGFQEELIKDYNGQAYWFSFDIYSFIKESNFPKWLNFALGYGAQNMVRGREFQNHEAGYDSYRQIYLGIDFDLSYINTQKKWLKTLLFILDGIHLPSPALELSGRGHKMRWFYY